MLEKAIRIAVDAHRGQEDRGGAPYILHPLRVMLQQTSDVARIIAVLHDVVEDTQVTISDLAREGFSQTVLDSLNLLTKREGEDYEVYIHRILDSELACRVKLADLNDNMDLSRLNTANPEDLVRLKKYQKAKQQIENRLGAKSY